VTRAGLTALLPFGVMAAASIVVMLGGAFRRNHAAAAGWTVAGFFLALATLPVAASVAPVSVAPLLVVDRYGLFYTGLVFAAGLVVAVLSYGYLRERRGAPEEFYVLLLLACLGSAVLVVASHFVSLILGLELLSVALYVLIAYTGEARRHLEASVKYLILAAAASAFLLFGLALIYAELGTMEFSAMAPALASRGAHSLILLAGLGMLITGVGFKLGVVPFHMWAADVYQGAPAPVTAFLATASKGAVFALLVRFSTHVDIRDYAPLVVALGVIAVASMLVGNLLALMQSHVKRLLAYSSIAHLGYLLVAFLAGGAAAVEAVTYYLVAYVVTTLGAFGVVTVLSSRDGDADDLEAYRGLLWRRPALGVAFSATLLSLAGIPLTAGFIGKFYVLTAGVASAMWALVLSVAITSAIGLFYYLRVVVVMFADPAVAPAAPGFPAASLPLASGLVVALLFLLLLWLGVYPAPLSHLIQAAFIRPV
jgi:NADH-quinone oxidoreductase subunit N